MKAGAPRDEDTNVGSVRSSPAVQSMPSWGAHTRQGPPVDHVADRSGMRHVAGNDTPEAGKCSVRPFTSVDRSGAPQAVLRSQSRSRDGISYSLKPWMATTA